MTNEDKNICFVCLEQNTENNNIKKVCTRCNCFAHKDCLHEYLNHGNKSCPQCKKSLSGIFSYNNDFNSKIKKMLRLFRYGSPEKRVEWSRVICSLILTIPSHYIPLFKLYHPKIEDLHKIIVGFQKAYGTKESQLAIEHLNK